MKRQNHRTVFDLPEHPVNRNRRVKRRMPRPLCWALTVAACSLLVWGYVEYAASLLGPYQGRELEPQPERSGDGRTLSF